MPRYIDAEQLEEGCFPEATNWYQEGWNDALKGAMLGAPAADVVPRERFDRVFGNLKAVLEERAEDKAEVAMEIFEEIYEDCFDQFGYIDYEKLAELKKKYTEAETDPPKESKR
jgi:hypothetical protein